ncbi:hypothetical protein V8E36_006284 [Tilletia maclaganii]
MPDEVLFDIFGQFVWGDLDPASLGEHLGDNKRKTWSTFIQNWSEDYHDAPSDIAPSSQEWWRELASDPSRDTWSALLEGSHTSQTSKSISSGKHRTVVQASEAATAGPSKAPAPVRPKAKPSSAPSLKDDARDPQRIRDRQRRLIRRQVDRQAHLSAESTKSSSSKAKPTIQAGASKKTKSAPQDNDNDIEYLSDADDDTDKPNAAKGIGSRGSRYATYFIPGKIRYEPRIETKTQKSYQAKIQMFRCRCCDVDVPVVDDRPSRLAQHFNGTTSVCKHKLNPRDPAMRGVFGEYTGPVKDKQATAVAGGTTPAGQHLPIAKSTRTPPNKHPLGLGPSGLTPLGSWLEDGKARSSQLQASITRLRATAWIISDAIPFTTFESEAFRSMIQTISPDALAAFKSGKTLGNNTFALSVDEWTPPGIQYAFQGLVSTYVTPQWEYKSFCVDFQVLRGRRGGSMFAGHIIDFLTRNGLLDNWSGVIASDSASNNTRMSALIAEYLEQKNLRPKFVTDITRNHVRCFAHHLNLAVQALYVGLGSPSEEMTGNSKMVMPAAATAGEEDGEPEDVAEPGTWSDEDDGDENNDRGAALRGADGDAGLVQGKSDDETEDDGDAEEVEVLRADMNVLSRLSPIPEEEEYGQPDEAGGAIDGVVEESQGEAAEPSSAQPGLSPLMKVARIVEIARKSPERRRKYERAAREAYKNRPSKTSKLTVPPAYNKTRWNSRYFQLLSALRYAKGMDFVTRSNPGDDYPADIVLSSKEIQQLRDLEMEKREPKATVVLRWHAKLAKQLEGARDDARESDNDYVRKTADGIDKAIKKLASYRGRAVACDALLLAAILHPGRRATKLEVE